MAQKSTQEEVMPLPQTKHFLTLAGKEALSCAFGLTKDRKEIFLLIQKSVKPKKVADQLKKDCQALIDQSSLRFGRLSIDAENDPDTVNFSINRAEGPGVERLMTRLVTKAGRQTAVFNIMEEEEDSAETAGDDEELEKDSEEPEEDDEKPQIDAGALKGRLTVLVQHMGPVIAAAPQHKEALLALAKQAQEKLGAHSLENAAQKIDELDAALKAAIGGRGNGGAPAGDATWEAPKSTDGAAVAFAKSSQLWRSCRRQMHSKLDELKAAVLDAYADEPEVQAALRSNLGLLDRAFDGLDTRLDDTLDAAISASDPALRQKLVGETRVIIADYITHVASNPSLQALDDNPFGVKLALKPTLSNVLTALVGLSKTMR